jgi:energy-coupling factor transporter ATP-binding protein EcfA2
MSRIKSNTFILLAGKRNTGKSTLLKHIMYHLRDIPAGVVFSGTDEATSFFSSFVPDSFIYPEFDSRVVENIIENQRKIAKSGKTPPNLFIILDDVAYDDRIFKLKCIRQLAMNGRHYNICVLMTTQYVMVIPPSIRCNLDFIFCLRETILQNRERLWKQFFGVVPTFQMFCQVMDATTANYEALICDNTTQSNDINKCIYWFKARLDLNFKIGSPAFWSFHKKHYNKNYDDPEGCDAAPLTTTNVGQRKRGGFVVQKKLS